MQSEVAEDIRTIFNAPDRATADAYLDKAVIKYQKMASRLSEWMATNIPEGLGFFLSGCFSEIASHDQWRGKTPPRSSPPGTSRLDLPKQSFLFTFGFCSAQLDQ